MHFVLLLFWLHPVACRTLQGWNLCPPHWDQSLNHRITREVPSKVFLSGTLHTPFVGIDSCNFDVRDENFFFIDSPKLGHRCHEKVSMLGSLEDYRVSITWTLPSESVVSPTSQEIT